MAKRQGAGLRYVLAGVVLFGLAKMIEIRGDVAPVAAEGVSSERLLYHGLALVVLLAALASFLRGGYLAIRRIIKGVTPATDELANVFADKDRPKNDSQKNDWPKNDWPKNDWAEEESFDPDAALARYFERKQAESYQAPGQDETPPRPPASGFGRKRI